MVKPTLFRLTQVALGVAGLWSTTAHSQPELEQPRNPWYQFEMLIFSFDESTTQEQLLKQPFNTEPMLRKAGREFSLDELFNPPAPAIDPAIDAPIDTGSLDSPSPLGASVIRLDGTTQSGIEGLTEEPLLMASVASEHVLNEYAQMLRYRRPYTVRYHRAWQQPLPPHSEVRKYNFSAGVPVIAPPIPEVSTIATEEFVAEELQIVELSETDFSFPDPTQAVLPLATTDTSDATFTDTAPLTAYQTAQEEINAQPPHIRQLQGSVYVYRKAFAHMIFDLWYAETDPLVPPQQLSFMVELPNLEANLSDDVLSLEAEIQAEQVFTALNDGNAIDSFLTPATDEPEFEIQYEDAYTARRFGHIHEDRRMRSGEMYYVDHPLFGIVLRMEKMTHPLERLEDAANTAP